MTTVIFEDEIEDNEKPHIQVTVRGVDGDPNEVNFTAILDTGSGQTVVNVGVFDDEVFAPDPTSAFGSHGIAYDSRLCEMLVTLKQSGKERTFKLPVYEMPLGICRPGSPLMLVGLTILNQGTFLYDGINKKWTLSFPVESSTA